MNRDYSRPCAPGTYRCAHHDCDRWAVTVDTRYWNTGNTTGVGFYGRCADH